VEARELELTIAAILTAASFSGHTTTIGADTTVERFREIVQTLRETGGLPMDDPDEGSPVTRRSGWFGRQSGWTTRGLAEGWA
jgi:hypothetical protein